MGFFLGLSGITWTQKSSIGATFCSLEAIVREKKCISKKAALKNHKLVKFFTNKNGSTVKSRKEIATNKIMVKWQHGIFHLI